MFERLDQIEARYEELDAGALVAGDHRRLGEIPEDCQGAQRDCGHRRKISRVQRPEKRHRRKQSRCSPTKKIPRCAPTRRKSWRKLEPRVSVIEEELKVLLLPKDPNDEKNVILEIRAGTGGDEATLFAAEMFRMYDRYAESQRWKVEVLSTSESRGRRTEGSNCAH